MPAFDMAVVTVRCAVDNVTLRERIFNWPGNRAGSYQKTISTASPATNTNGVSYLSTAGNLSFTTLIEGKFYQSDLTTVVDDTYGDGFSGTPCTDDGYLAIKATTTIDGDGTSIKLEAVKSKAYTRRKGLGLCGDS